MGLLKAGVGALGGVLADQWREFFYCESLNADVLMAKGEKKTGGRSSNKKGENNIISNGSIISVNEGQCMIIVESGKVVDFCAETGEFVYDTSTEPSLLYGGFGEGIKKSFQQVGKRFTFGGDAGKDQRVYYFNTKEIIDNKFGTANPFMFKVSDPEIGYSKTVKVRCNGIYSYKITDPLLFYKEVAGNVEGEYTRDLIDGQLKTEFISALQPAFAELSELRMLPTEIPGKTKELKDAMNEALKTEWTERRGITVVSIALNPITLSDEDMAKIAEFEDSLTMGKNPYMMAGRAATAAANAMENAASNPNGAMGGFVGMGMAMNANGGGFNQAQNLYAMGQQATPAAQAAPAPAANGWTCKCGATATGKFCPECGSPKPSEDGWTCSCGSVNKGKFCQNCGAKKPEGAPLYKCDKCGWEPEDPHHPPKFCPECGDIFDEKDVK